MSGWLRRRIAICTKWLEMGKFREDLLYRLEVVPLTVPPLRERREEISRLLQAFFHQYTQEFGEQRTISPAALGLLEAYDFPGNVRELRNLVARLIICARKPVIDVCDLPEGVQRQRATHNDRVEPHAVKPADRAAQIPLKKQLQETERSILEQYAREFRSIREVARYLGLNPSSVVRKMRKYKLVMGSGGV
jgi:DNA-binding NtrC family response regulator